MWKIGSAVVIGASDSRLFLKIKVPVLLPIELRSGTREEFETKQEAAPLG